jgi:hypothetical protein
MIECIFTIDYEIYGDGEGSLRDLVYDPAERLRELFEDSGTKFVVFVEAAEFEKIAGLKTDAAIGLVERQIRYFYEQGYEIGLHLHPQWCNAQYREGKWVLDYSEYNLCPLPRERIAEIVEGAISYLRNVLRTPDFTPVSFRAGNWLFQPTRTAAEVMAELGLKIDSSVFKGGVQRKHKLDYRRAAKNGFYWTFGEDVATADPDGAMLEIPIYTRMVPFWKMATAKRLGLQKKSSSSARKSRRRRDLVMDLLRLRQPLKFDFCRMTFNELVSTMEMAIREDEKSPKLLKPIVAIGHTKDLVDFSTIREFLSWVRMKGIRVSTLKSVYQTCQENLAGRNRISLGKDAAVALAR